jgi:L-serine deaminase
MRFGISNYFFLSSKSQTARMARTTAAITLGQRGTVTLPATTLTCKKKRHNWAMAIKRNKIAANSDAGRFMVLPPDKKATFLFKDTWNVY